MKAWHFLVIFGLFFSACGYTSTSKLTNNIFSQKVYVNVELSAYDPENSVFIADTLKEIVITKLGRQLALKDEPADLINVRISNLTYSPLIYDKNGYVVRYKAKLNLIFDISFKNGEKQNLQTQGSYDFDISPNSIISDNARSNAIANAASEAFDEFISRLAMKGSRVEY